MIIDDYKWGILERRRIAIFPVALLMHAYTSRMKPLVGLDHKHFIMSYSNGFLTSFKDENDWSAVSRGTYLYLKQHPNCIKDITKAFHRQVAELISHSKRMGAYNGNITDNTAADLFNRYCDLYIDVSVHGECVPYTIKEILAHELYDILSKYKNASEIFSLLTVPYCHSFTMREEIDFLKRLKEYKASGNNKEQIILQHHADYSWLTYDYDDECWSTEDIRNKFDIHAGMDDRAIVSRTNDLGLFIDDARRSERLCIERHGIDEYVIMISEILKDSITLMDVKKEYLTKAHYHTYNFFLRAANYLGIERKYLSYIAPYEFSDIIKHGKTDLLAKRYNHSSLYISENGWTFVDVPKEILALSAESGKGKIAKGLCAYPGKIAGSARIVRTVEDIKSFRNGEVLIATMTTVDFLEAMKRACAIVTDDGGVICHAAIVSREMKKPCIVGSRSATNTFKDGDVVFVDADNGIVTLKDGGNYDF